ncbi:MAG: response regulator [Leptospiraceae bacterium]|nr:response regulator [Leptospiraceae bacterium]MCP5497731.1 response regulator [Leptospiraceae bacterium]
MKNNSETLILIVDDDETNIAVFDMLLKLENYQTIISKNGKDAIEKTASKQPDLVLLDVMMPIMDGFEVAKRLKGDPNTNKIPIIIITALNDHSSRLKGLEAGAEDFINKPVDKAELLARVKNLVRLKAYNDLLANNNRILEERVHEKTQELRNSYIETITTLCNAAEFKDEETGQHVKRISYYCKLISEALGMDSKFSELMFYSSPMHDIGKIGIPDHILLKKTPFTPEEWEIMKSHSTYGYNILKSGSSPYMQTGAEIALSHHERWDGTGYPKGLKNEEIPLVARIMNICDQYDALRSQRPYKPEFTHDFSYNIILNGDKRTKPEHFDPNILSAFAKIHLQFDEIYNTYRDKRTS